MATHGNPVSDGVARPRLQRASRRSPWGECKPQRKRRLLDGQLQEQVDSPTDGRRCPLLGMRHVVSIGPARAGMFLYRGFVHASCCARLISTSVRGVRFHAVPRFAELASRTPAVMSDARPSGGD